ncbi:MAG: adenosylcobinamide-GDP ribazoletransferase [Theionarchaea archaeon]|nr:adenosylcobinamide-GDP ribazoletransferase [Theionarchaea archaeon]MBU7041105.1 adenosylcobinamide-GDP ribazoletransferase [Theionarchaea archaeon]
MKRVRYALAFLTRIPVKGGTLEETAEASYVFPLIGLCVGCASFAFSWCAHRVFPYTLAGVFTLGFLMVLTGLHHTDGLLDMGDALLVTGTREKKIDVMHDHFIGIGGFFLAFFVLLTTVFCIVEFMALNSLFVGLIGSEVSAKFSMNCIAFFGTPSHEGMGSRVIQATDRKLFLKSCLISGIVLSVFLEVGALLFVSTLVFAYLLAVGAERNLGGIGGDFIGAAHDTTRMMSMILLIVVMR